MTPPAAAGPSGWRLALLAFGGLITALDFTIVYVALPDIGDELGFSAHALQWVVSAYAIAYGGFLLLGGRLSDLLGRRRMFVAGMLLFGGASLLGALAGTPAHLVAARVLQGIGGAILFPATLALVSTTFAEGPERNRAMSVWAGAGAAGLSLGALLGGVLTEAVGWSGVFYVNVPLVVIGAVAAFRLLPADGPRAEGRDLDLPGAVSGTAGVSLLVLAIAQVSQEGWTSALVLGPFAAALLLLGAFVRIEARSSNPLMPLRLLAAPGLRAAVPVILAYGATLQAAPYFFTMQFQQVLGFSALEGGLAFLVPTFAITTGNALADRVVAWRGTRAALIAGMLVGAAGGLLLSTELSADGSYARILPGVVLVSLGMGLVWPPMFLAASSGVAAREQGAASGIASTALQVGTGMGLAILVGIATADLGGLRGEPLRAATADGLETAFVVLGAGALLGALAALALPRAGRADADPPRETPAGTGVGV